jgi:hypothetical protein
MFASFASWRCVGLTSPVRHAVAKLFTEVEASGAAVSGVMNHHIHIHEAGANIFPICKAANWNQLPHAA